MKINYKQINENTINALKKYGMLDFDLLKLLKIARLTRDIIDKVTEIEKTVNDKLIVLKKKHDDNVLINNDLYKQLDDLYNNIHFEFDDDITIKIDELSKLDKDKSLNSNDLDGIHFLIKV